jgi:hypothetical protein
MVKGIDATAHGLARDRHDLNFVSTTLEEVAEASKLIIQKHHHASDELQAAFRQS